MRKHVEQEHPLLSKRFEDQVSSKIKDPLERQLVKKQCAITPGLILSSFGSVDHFKKGDAGQQAFLERTLSSML